MEVEIDLDSYDNLILLCKTHHKLVDDQMERFPAQRLRKIKAAHEHWVREALGGQGAKSQDGLNGPSFNGVTLMPRIKTGRELVSVIRGAHLFHFDNDEVESQEEMEIVSEFLQYLHDWGDILDELGAGEIVRVGFQLSQELEELERNGFLVFGERRRRRMNWGGLIDTWQVATVLVLREGNPAILNLSK
jgi:hypothetical protein